MKNLILPIALLLMTSLNASAEPVVTSQSRSISFEGCLETIKTFSSQIGVAPINIIETSIMRTVRYPTKEGSVLVTCSKPDNKMVLTTSIGN